MTPHTHTKIILYYCFEVKHLVKKVVHPLSSGDQQASAMLKIMAQLSPEDLDSVAMAWAAIGAEVWIRRFHVRQLKSQTNGREAFAAIMPSVGSLFGG